MFALLPTRRKSQRVDHPHRGPVRRRKLVGSVKCFILCRGACPTLQLAVRIVGLELVSETHCANGELVVTQGGTI